MPRVKGRDIGLLKKVTEQVVVDLVTEGLSAGDGNPEGLLPVGLDQVAAEVSRRTGETVTSGFLQGNYETKGALVEQALRSYLGPSTSDAQAVVDSYLAELVGGEDPVHARARLAERDMKNMTVEAPEWTRLGFAIHARAANPSFRAPLTEMYEAFDVVMIPAYERDLSARGRRLRNGYSMEDLAAAYTAVSEGLALRALASDNPEPFHNLAGPLAEAVTQAMTDPDSDDTQ